MLPATVALTSRTEKSARRGGCRTTAGRAVVGNGSGPVRFSGQPIRPTPPCGPGLWSWEGRRVMRLANGMFMSVRRARASDGPRCAEIFLEGRRRASPWQPADRFCLADFYDCVEEELVVVAEAWGRVVGFVSVDHSERFIHALFVDPAWQNRGIARLLGPQRGRTGLLPAPGVGGGRADGVAGRPSRPLSQDRRQLKHE